MNLHLTVNDRFIELFIDKVIELDLLESNRFLIYGAPGIPFKNRTEDSNRIFVDDLDSQIDYISSEIKKTKTIYIHFLTEEISKLLLKNDLRGKTIIWVFWGVDGFSIPPIRKQISKVYDQKTDFYLRKIKDTIKFFLPFLVKKTLKTTKIELLQYISLFAHYIPEDYELFKSLQKNLKFLNFSYGTLDKIVFEQEVFKESILVGNSADPSNYHIYILRNILPKKFENKIICPLSYGAENNYCNKVISIGQKIYKNEFIPLTELIDYQEYNRVYLSECAFAVMYHTQSQAWGNIMQLLWQGSKVFMNPKSNLYKFLINQGFWVFPITKRLNKKDLVKLSNIQKGKNRELLEMKFGNESTNKNYSNLLSL